MTPSPLSAMPPATTTARPRLDSVDLLRGLIMVLMALDHVRDFFTNVPFDPLDLTQTNAALFLTRWFTHFCAPTFTFLAGTGAFLASTRGKTKTELSWFLISRGLWLALLEVTWVRCLGWEFNFDFHSVGVGTLWSIGWSMFVLGFLIYLPTWAVAAIGIVMIAGHNRFDAVNPENWGAWAWLWKVLHTAGAAGVTTPALGYRFAIGYPLIPWIGVVAAGYGFGALLQREPKERQKLILGLGIGLTALFVALRFTNTYGNFPYGTSYHWSVQKNFLFTIFSFIDCHKYPPSLLYLLMTLGPALIVLALLDRGTPAILKPFLVFGRVPLFYYLLHIPLIHGLAVIVAYARFGRADWLFSSPFAPPGTNSIPADNGFGLPVVYLVWIGLVVALYPLCCWFAEVKRRRRDAWLSYL
ncbi:MAG: DUF1624 domain-containing protein [Verrucomicrobia bacterium]|nr:DUF1624 domain-containing protein [Verrucomicrobiota bacterium]